MTQITHPSAASAGQQYTYDSYEQVTVSTDPLGHETLYDYDSTGNLIEVIDPEGNVTITEYDLLGNMAKLTNIPLDPPSKGDVRRQITTYTYETGGCSSCGTRGGGRLTMIKDHDNNETEFRYDEHGNRTKVIDALNRETDFAYDSRNRLITVTSPSGSSNVMTYQYNVIGRMIKSISFEGEETAYEYDFLGRTKKVTKAGIANEFIYTGMQLTKVKDGLNHEWTYAYDSAKRLSTLNNIPLDPPSKGDKIGKVTKYFYDSQGRMTKVGAGSTKGGGDRRHFHVPGFR